MRYYQTESTEEVLRSSLVGKYSRGKLVPRNLNEHCLNAMLLLPYVILIMSDTVGTFSFT